MGRRTKENQVLILISYVVILISLITATIKVADEVESERLNNILDTKLENVMTLSLQQPEWLFEGQPQEQLLDALEYYDILYPEIVFAQARLETGNFTSPLCTKYNNLFGLYNSRTESYYHFDHWSESILAYKKYIQYRYREGEDYYKFLKRIGYATDPEYINKLKQLVK